MKDEHADGDNFWYHDRNHDALVAFSLIRTKI